MKLIQFGPIMPTDLILLWRYPQFLFIAGGVLLMLLALWLLFFAGNTKRCVARLGGLRWKRTQFCRGWLITGDMKSERIGCETPVDPRRIGLNLNRKEDWI